MNEENIKYIQSCPECQKHKAARHKSYGLLQPLEFGFSPWSSIAMDFITDHPLSDGCDRLWVIIDRYTKMAHFIPLKKQEKIAENLVLIFSREIGRLHGIPSNIVSDQDSRFTSSFGWHSDLPSVLNLGCCQRVILRPTGRQRELTRLLKPS
jgi:hypothetical protein